MSPRTDDIRRRFGEHARSGALARHFSNAAAAAVYFGPANTGYPRSTRLTRAFVLRRRVRKAFTSMEKKQEKRANYKGALALTALAVVAVVVGKRRSSSDPAD